MFGKRGKKSKEELAREREARIASTADKLKVQIVAMENKKTALLAKVVEAKNKGLKVQEQQARGLLGRCLASLKRANGMLMTLELAVQSRDLAELNYQFLECIGDLSDEVVVAASKADAKKAEKKYTKALYKAGEQTRQLDEMLAVGDFAASVSMDADGFTEFDEEIDALVQDAQSSSVYTADKLKH